MENDLISRLVTILKKEYRYYQRLNKLALGKKDSIIDNDVDKLSQLVKEDDRIITDLEELEKERILIMDKLAELYKLDPGNINYSQLIKLIPESWQEELVSLREDLLIIIDELHDRNQQNKVLIEEAIKINNFSLNVLMKALEPDNQTYGKNSNSPDKDKITHLIDRRA